MAYIRINYTSLTSKTNKIILGFKVLDVPRKLIDNSAPARALGAYIY